MTVGFWVKLGIAALALGYLATSGTLTLNFREFDANGWALLALGTALNAGSCLVGYIRWWVFVRRARVKFSTVWSLSWASMFVNTCIPGGVGGDLLRGLTLGGSLTRAQGLASVAADRGIAILALVVLNGVFLLFDQSILEAIFAYRAATVGLTLVVTLLVLAVVLGPRVSGHIKTWLAPWRGQPQTWAMGFGLGLLGHALTCAGLICYLHALPGAMPATARILSHLPLALALAGIPALPGGLGIGHLAFAAILGFAGVARAGDLYSLYAIQLFVLSIFGVLPFLRLRIPLRELFRYNQRA